MIKSLAWNTFKNTGNINTYLELSQVIGISEAIALKNSQSSLLKQDKEDIRVISEAKAEAYGDDKNKGNSDTREYLK